MLEFENFVYLDVEKTGSTTVRRFLRKFARTKIVTDVKHEPVKTQNPNKLYIISCRDPLKQYLSLYLHGNAGNGRLLARLRRVDMGDFYDGTIGGFSAWLELLLESASSDYHFRGATKRRLMDIMGLQTLRFLTLAFASPLEVFETLHDKADVAKRLKTDGLYKVVLKTETLADDLKKLVTGKYAKFFHDQDEAVAFFDEDRRSNVSTNPGIDLNDLSLELVARVQEREWFFFDHLGYRPYVADLRVRPSPSGRKGKP